MHNGSLPTRLLLYTCRLVCSIVSVDRLVISMQLPDCVAASGTATRMHYTTPTAGSIFLLSYLHYATRIVVL